MRVGFFDRDGTIICDHPDADWRAIDQPDFVDGAVRALNYVTKRGYQIVVITNQYLINEGFITQEQYERITAKMLCELDSSGVHVLDVFYCPHRRNEGCTCMKPKTGMVEQALAKYPTIELSQSFMVGDSVVDMELALNVGIKGFGINAFLDNEHIQTIGSIAELPEYI